MSFVTVPGPHYIKRTLVNVNSNNKTIDSRSNYDFKYLLDESIQNVFSIELVQYDVPCASIPTYTGKIEQSKIFETTTVEFDLGFSNSITDVQFKDETGTETLNIVSDMSFSHYIFLFFGGTLPLAGLPFLSPDIVRFFFFFDLASLFSLSTHPVLNATNYTLLVGVDPETSKIAIQLAKVGAPGVYGTVQLLYGTGKNRSRQSSNALGFKFGEDTPMLASNNFGVLAEYTASAYPFRYLDVNLQETSEFNPMARIYVTQENPLSAIQYVSSVSAFATEDYISPNDIPHGCRILKNPIWDLRELQVNLTLKNGATAPNISNVGVDLTFEVYSLEQVPKVPGWVDQRLEL